MPDTRLIVADGCLSSDTLKNAGDAAEGVLASSPDISVFQGDPSTPTSSSPPTRRRSARAPLSVFHAHAYDAVNVLFEAIEAVAIDNGDGSLSIPRQALRDARLRDERLRGGHGHDHLHRSWATAPPT